MFSPGFVLQSSNNYGVVKTEAVFGFGPNKNFDQNDRSSEPLEMFFGKESFGRSFQDSDKTSQMQLKKSTNRHENNKIMEKRNRKKHSNIKIKKCFYKLLKGKGKKKKIFKKLLLPVLIGILVAKSLLVSLALKALAFVLFKGLLIGFVSATILSLKGILNHPYGYHHRRDDGNEIKNIYLPSKRDTYKDYRKKYY